MKIFLRKASLPSVFNKRFIKVVVTLVCVIFFCDMKKCDRLLSWTCRPCNFRTSMDDRFTINNANSAFISIMYKSSKDKRRFIYQNLVLRLNWNFIYKKGFVASEILKPLQPSRHHWSQKIKKVWEYCYSSDTEINNNWHRSQILVVFFFVDGQGEVVFLLMNYWLSF